MGVSVLHRNFLGMVAHAFNSITLGTEAGGSEFKALSGDQRVKLSIETRQWWHTLLTTVLRRKQKDREFKVTLGYTH